MASTFQKQRGVFGDQQKKTSGETFRNEIGEDSERCPFCGTLVPLQYTDCRGCGAMRVSETPIKVILVIMAFPLVCLYLYLLLKW